MKRNTLAAGLWLLMFVGWAANTVYDFACHSVWAGVASGIIALCSLERAGYWLDKEGGDKGGN